MVTRRLRPPGRLALLPALLLAGGVAAAGGAQTAHAAAGPCTAPSSGGSGSVNININTGSGNCDDTNAQAGNPSTGFVTIGLKAAGGTATAVFSTEGNPAHNYYSGNYAVTLSNCVGGTVTPGTATYSVGSGNQYPSPPQTGSNVDYAYGNSPFTFTGNAGSSTVSCQYSLVPPATATSDPNAVSYTVDVAVFFSSGSTHARTASVKSPSAGQTPPPPTTATPELNSSELVGTSLVPLVGLYLYRRNRRRRAK